MLALALCAVLTSADAPAGLPALRPAPRFEVSLRSDAPPPTAPVRPWREPPAFELELAAPPATSRWPRLELAGPSEAPRRLPGLSDEFERVMRLYRGAEPAWSVVVSTSERPCF